MRNIPTNCVEYFHLSDNPNFEPDLTLLLLDLKLSKLDDRSKAIAGEDLAYKLVSNLFSKSSYSTPLNVVLCIGSVADIEFVRGFQEVVDYHKLDRLRKFIGWDVGKKIAKHCADKISLLN